MILSLVILAVIAESDWVQFNFCYDLFTRQRGRHSSSSQRVHFFSLQMAVQND